MMIPAHAWGAIERRHGTRRVLTDWWIVVDVPGTGRERDDQGKDIEPMGQGAAALIDNAAPDNAWHGTARELAALLRPVTGVHCKACDDVGSKTCACCGGEGTLACEDAACDEVHGCVPCDGTGSRGCVCAISHNVFARIRGSIYDAGLLVPLRRMLPAAGDAPVAAWVQDAPTVDGHGRPCIAGVFVVDCNNVRFALANRLLSAEDQRRSTVHEVALREVPRG